VPWLFGLGLCHALSCCLPVNVFACVMVPVCHAEFLSYPCSSAFNTGAAQPNSIIPLPVRSLVLHLRFQDSFLLSHATSPPARACPPYVLECHFPLALLPQIQCCSCPPPPLRLLLLPTVTSTHTTGHAPWTAGGPLVQVRGRVIADFAPVNAFRRDAWKFGMIVCCNTGSRALYIARIWVTHKQIECDIPGDSERFSS
jgi:hypothetical protein